MLCDVPSHWILHISYHTIRRWSVFRSSTHWIDRSCYSEDKMPLATRHCCMSRVEVRNILTDHLPGYTRYPCRVMSIKMSDSLEPKHRKMILYHLCWCKCFYNIVLRSLVSHIDPFPQVTGLLTNDHCSQRWYPLFFHALCPHHYQHRQMLCMNCFNSCFSWRYS